MRKQHAEHTPVLALVGPTAIGKTRLSIDLAQAFNCEIVSVDSMQVYRYMNIGTAKITSSEMSGITHHLIDIVDPDEEYDASRFVNDSTSAIYSITGRGKLPLLTGGTGLYLKALMDGLAEGLPEDKNIRDELKLRLAREGGSKLHEELATCDPETAKRVHPNDSMRIVRGLEIFLSTGTPWSSHLKASGADAEQGEFAKNSLIIGLTCEREKLYSRINRRVEIMLKEGLEDEVQWLLARGYGRELKSMGAIGYRHMANYIFKEWSYAEMKELLARDTRRYAKRQFTWFGKVNGIEWFDVQGHAEIQDRVGSWLITHNS